MALTEQELLDRAEIFDALIAYSQGLDQRNWDLFDRAFTPDAALRFPGSGHHPLTPAEFKELLRSQNDSTRLSGQHNLYNPHYRIEGDTAHVVTEFTWLTLQQSHEPGLLYEVSGGGLYVDDLARTADGWRITARNVGQKSHLTRHVPYPADRIEAIRKTLHGHWY